MFASSLSRKILIASLIMMLLAIFNVLVLEITFATMLQPTLVYPGLQIWRFLSYPIGLEWFGLFMAIITFSIPGEEMETMLGTKQFGILLLMMTFLVGLMHTAFYFKGPQVLVGPANMAFFVLVGYVYLYPHSEVQVIFFLRLRSWVLLALFSAVLLAITISNTLSIKDLFGFFSGGGFGLFLGACYFHARFQKYPFMLKPIRSVERIAGITKFSPVVRKPAAVQRRTATQQPVRVRIPFQKQVVREMSDEERLNMILEKINEKSINALSEEEKKFLRDYSGRL